MRVAEGLQPRAGDTFPTLSGRVVDEANILDASTRAALTEKLAALEAKTTDQLVVVTLKSLQGTSIEDFGYQLGRHWKVGQQGKNNGVLLIVAPSERKVRIEVGYGLEGTLTDASPGSSSRTRSSRASAPTTSPAASPAASTTSSACSPATPRNGSSAPPSGRMRRAGWSSC